MSEIVTLNHRRVPTTTSLLVAEKFDKRHKNVIRAIESLDCSQGFNRLNFEPIKYMDKKGEERLCYEITKDGFSFLCMSFTGKKAAKWKETYISAFNRMERELRQIREQRLELTDVIALFSQYALEQGCKGTARNAYTNFTNPVNKACGIEPGRRDNLTKEMLRRVARFEDILAERLVVLMRQGLYCKEIFRRCGKTLSAVAEAMPFAGGIYLPTEEERMFLSTEGEVLA